MKTTETFIQLDFLMTVSEDCCGKSFSARIGEIPFTLKLPFCKPGDERLYSPLNPILTEKKAEAYYLKNGWGSLSYSREKGRAFHLKAFVLSTTTEFKIENELFEQIDAFLERFRQWIEVLARKSTRGGLSKNGNKMFGFLWQIDDGEITDETIRSSNITVNIYREWIDFESLTAAIQKSESSIEMPIALKLLNLAREYLYNEDYRLSVVESCTALEIVLTESLEVNLNAQVSNELTKDLIGLKYRTLGELFKLSQLAKHSTYPPDFQVSVTSLRNKVIHDGLIPSAEEARKCFKYAEEKIYELCEAELR